MSVMNKPHEFLTLAGINPDYLLVVPGDVHELAKALRCFQVKTPQCVVIVPKCPLSLVVSNCLSKFKGSF